MPIKNIRHPGNDTYYGKITSLDEDEKKVLSEVGMVSESNFDSTLFSVDTNGKISLSNIYNDYGVLSILSDENYAIDLKDYIKFVDNKGDILVTIDTNNTEINNHLQVDGSMEVTGDASFKGVVEVPTPTTNGQAVNKEYVDKLFSSIVNGDNLKY